MPGIRGFVAQGLDGQKKPRTPAVAIYAPGTFTFRVAAPGVYRIAVRGHGGAAGPAAGSQAGGSGSLLIADRPLGAGQTLAIYVPFAPMLASAVPLWTTVTLPDGEVLSAGGGYGAAGGAPTAKGGVATGNLARGDIVLAGTDGVAGTGAGNPGNGDQGGAGGASNGSKAGGAGAPGTRGFRGADATPGDTFVCATGTGAPATSSTTYHLPGGHGEVTIVQVKMRR